MIEYEFLVKRGRYGEARLLSFDGAYAKRSPKGPAISGGLLASISKPGEKKDAMVVDFYVENSEHKKLAEKQAF